MQNTHNHHFNQRHDHTDQFAYIHQELMDEVEGCQYFVQGHNQQLCACELTCVVVE